MFEVLRADPCRFLETLLEPRSVYRLWRNWRRRGTSAILAEISTKLEALRGVKTINEIGQEYGVHPVQVGQWKKKIQEQASSLFEGKRGPKPVAAHREPELLYSEIGKLKMELDWLKKNPGSACRDQARMDRSREVGGYRRTKNRGDLTLSVYAIRVVCNGMPSTHQSSCHHCGK